MPKKVYIRTFGCQMNSRDSEIIYGMLIARGWEKAEFMEDADCILINTCSVRHHAEQRAYSNMGALAKLKRNKPGLVLGFIGCTAEKDKKIVIERLPHVDLVVGPSNIYDIPGCIEDVMRNKKVVIAVGNKARPEHKNPLYHENPEKAYISISEGCGNYCSYCIVPYVRGRQKSRSGDIILEEAHLAAKNGIKEITLLGQNVNSYGKDLEDGFDFTELLAKVSGIEPIKRIRFVTCHPKDTKEELFRVMRNLPKVYKHLHLPLQSGSAKILKTMKRGYPPEYYLNLVEKLRKYMPDCNLTTDIIVGFPGESDEDFKDTLNMMERIRFDSAYVYKYSPRPPAESCKLADDVSEESKKKRHAVLLNIQKEISKEKSKTRKSCALPMA